MSTVYQKYSLIFDLKLSLFSWKETVGNGSFTTDELNLHPSKVHVKIQRVLAEFNAEHGPYV